MFIGFTRFSLYQPSASSWKATRRLNEEDYRDKLFSPERMNMRADIFLNWSLPQLEIAARHHNIKHVVSFSDVLPSKYRLLLEEANDKYDFLILDLCRGSEKPMTSSQVLDLYAPSSRNIYFAEYRLDDDDIISADYFDRLQGYVAPSFHGMFVSFASGITALYIDGELYYARKSLQRLIAIGFAKICHLDYDGTVDGPASIAHSRSDTVAPVILDSRTASYLWIRHLEQDSFMDLSQSADALNKIRSRMSKFPAAKNREEIKRQFPAVADKIHTEKAPGIHQTVLVSERTTVPTSGLKMSFPPITGKIELSVEMRTVKTSTHRNLLASFELVDSDGNALRREEWEDSLKEVGLRYSASRNIGFYRYFTTRDEMTVGEMQLDLPQAIQLRGITFIKYRDPNAIVQIDRATVSHSIEQPQCSY